MFMKDIFPDVPLLCYFEWFYNAKGGDVGFDGKESSIDDLAKLRTKNSHLLIDLYSCDAGICPTKFQKKQFPNEFQSKIKVLHDGVDTDFCSPKENTKFVIKDKNLTLTKNDEVVTYATISNLHKEIEHINIKVNFDCKNHVIQYYDKSLNIGFKNDNNFIENTLIMD